MCVEMMTVVMQGEGVVAMAVYCSDLPSRELGARREIGQQPRAAENLDHGVIHTVAMLHLDRC